MTAISLASWALFEMQSRLQRFERCRAANYNRIWSKVLNELTADIDRNRPI